MTPGSNWSRPPSTPSQSHPTRLVNCGAPRPNEALFRAALSAALIQCGQIRNP